MPAGWALLALFSKFLFDKFVFFLDDILDSVVLPQIGVDNVFSYGCIGLYGGVQKVRICITFHFNCFEFSITHKIFLVIDLFVYGIFFLNEYFLLS